ncbi:hypothetical protein ACIBBD_08020 [Streptomyces sp. NPDC051315]|uniref:hypothetical protein n=1 Tax=Streptomyces sp. NPDC051315 TaxID=3365650 RepID=UPI0037A5DE93
MSRRLRTALSAVLIALACLLLPFGTLAAWAAYGLTDTGRYVTTMAPLASDPAVRDEVVDTVADGLLREAASDRRRPLHPEVTPFVHDAVRSFTHTAAYRRAWDAGNEEAHKAVMTALHADRGGGVTVDLAPVATRLKHQLAADHVPFADKVPVTHTRVALLPAGELAALRKGYHVLDIAGFWLPLAAVALAVTGIGVAVGRRRALAATALGTALGGACLALAVAIGRRLTLADLADQSHRPAAAAIYDALTATLRTASWLLVGVGLTVAGGVWAGRRVRCAGLRPALTHPPARNTRTRNGARPAAPPRTPAGRPPRRPHRSAPDWGSAPVLSRHRPPPAPPPPAPPAPGPVPPPPPTRGPV